MFSFYHTAATDSIRIAISLFLGTHIFYGSTLFSNIKA